MNPARLLAVRSLTEIRKKGRYANLELDTVLRHSDLDGRDAALFTTLVYGVIEREITLDHHIRRFCTRKPGGLSPFLRADLQVALYQLCYLSAPARAVLYDAAEIAKLAEKQSGAGLVSAVLHAFLRAKEAGEDLLVPMEDEDARSIRYALPAWMLKLWDEAYGAERADRIAESFLTPAATMLRVNTLRISPEALKSKLSDAGIIAEAHPHLPEVLVLPASHGDLRALPGYDDGLFFVQDASSVLAVRSLDPHPGESIADVCAAPGGKSFSAAILMENRGSITARDLHPNRVRLIEAGAGRLGITVIRAGVGDARLTPEEECGKYDRVLCDVPCSGLGVLRKKPDLRHKSPEEIASLPKIQSDILFAASRLVRPGGRLVYSTCTLSPAENEEVVQGFLSSSPDFSPASPMTTLFPDDGLWDGFFYASMEKKNA